MKFIDSTKIQAHGGKGGDGLCCFHRARNRPKLGPNGGNGGNGGSVFLVANSNMNTLSSLRYKQLIKAESGEKGGPNNRTGRCGEDRLIPVPCGTIARRVSDQKILGEVLQSGCQLKLAQGGKRGYGNVAFTTSTNRAPTQATEGTLGEEVEIELELKLIADVGLAGFPNAGKSSLVKNISAARPKVADYPFTTLEPNLGVVEPSASIGLRKSFVIADIPGLVSGASEGKGLGLQFLRHLERTKIIAFVIDLNHSSGLSGKEQLDALTRELNSFSESFAEKKQIVIFSKSDLHLDEEKVEQEKASIINCGYETYCVSAHTRDGLEQLKSGLLQIVSNNES